MSDSPALQPPLDPDEQPILERVLGLRADLSLLKQDKSTYVRAQDVESLYEKVIQEVHQLNVLRAEREKPLESNRVDRVLDDCFQLISLFFLTIGRSNEAPAVYSITSTIKRLLDHLVEAAFFTAKDLESIGKTLSQMKNDLKLSHSTHSPHLLTLLENRLNVCGGLLAKLQASVADLSPTLTPIHERLVSILRSIAAANTRTKFPRTEVENFRRQLTEIESRMRSGGFDEPDGSTPSGSKIIVHLIERCLLWSNIVLEKQGQIDPRFKRPYEDLCEIRNQLERLSITQAWSLREIDLYNYQRQLDRFDESRVNGNFEDAQGVKADIHAQRTLLYLLRRSYAYIYILLVSSEPVSEALLPIYNQLHTLRNCLLEVKRSGGVSSARDLYPYSMKLSSIDGMRVDGKFLVGSDIPEGQGSLISLLNECFDIRHSLKVEAEERQANVSS